MAFIVILLAELLAIILALAHTADTSDLVFDLALYSLFIQLVALSSAASLCVSRTFLNRLPTGLIAACSYGLILLVSFCVIQLVWLFMHKEPVMDAIAQSHTLYTLRCMCITAITAALVLRYLYVQHQWRNQIEAESRARIDALQARIRPHFLFNCMNTIASLTRKEPKLAEESIENLAALFRASLQTSEQMSTLEKEFELCRQYLSIEQLRLGDRLHCNWQIDGVPLSTAIPALTLQPLIENAIYHGIEPLAEGGTIHIIVEKTDDRYVRIIIRNPVSHTQSTHHDGNQVAQENVRQRLATLYPDINSFTIDTDSDEYRVIITLPIT